MCSTATQRVILIACGSFNPPTIMHLRMFELARDYLHKLGRFNVIGGIITPVHDAYGKKGLAPSHHRLEMVRLALENNSWVKLSSWEAEQHNVWTRTRPVLDYHQSCIDKYISGEIMEKEKWMPEILEPNSVPVTCKLLCGADVLESFNIPGLWSAHDMLTIAKDFGIVSITRSGNDPLISIHKSDALHENQNNLFIVREFISNDISSTEIRLALRRGQSIRYLVPDLVINYMKKEELYLTS